MDTFFSNRRALVVGGSGGIGKALTLALAKTGAQLFIHGGHSKTQLYEILRQIQPEHLRF